jgi:hypothetical protein
MMGIIKNKMKIMKTILITLLVSAMAFSQTAQDPPMTKEETYKIYANLLGGKWETKGTWEIGAAYHQEKIVEMELTKKIFTVKTYDYIDSKKFDNSQRNYGIRAWDSKEQKMKFWEFDVFGGITTGEVLIDNNDIYHIYEYHDKTLVDAWIYVDKDTYTLKICEYNDGKFGKEYMTSTYKRK